MLVGIATSNQALISIKYKQQYFLKVVQLFLAQINNSIVLSLAFYTKIFEAQNAVN